MMHARLEAEADSLSGSDTVAERIRALDWAATPVGPMETWPQSLRTAVNMILHSKFPTYLAWGPQFTSFYNDAYRPILGAKPEALGQPFREAWDVMGPIARQAMNGEASYFEDLPITLERHGYPEETWWTFSYSPIHDETGKPGGVLCIVHDTTPKVSGEQRLEFLIRLGDHLRKLADPTEVALKAAEMFGQHLQAARAGYGEIDEAQEKVLVRRDWTDGTVGSLAGEARILDAFGPAIIAELRAGRTLLVEDCLTDHRAGETYAATWASIGTRSLIVVPLVRDGQLKALFYVHEPKPRRWSDAQATLARDVAERTWDAIERARAETALRTSESRLWLAVDAGHMAVWEHETATDTVNASPELNRLLGYPVDSKFQLAEMRRRYYPGDRERLRSAALDALKRGERFFEAEYRFYRRDGALRWFLMRAEMQLGPDGAPVRTVGVILDITDRKEAEEALREREAELRAALEAGSLAIFDYDHLKAAMNPSPRLSELYGYPPDKVLTIADIRARYHPDDVEQIWNKVRSEYDDASIRYFDWTLRLLMPDGVTRWVNGRGEYLRDELGRIIRSRGVLMDITERRRWEEHQELLINELNHRVKNTLATVQSIASQTLRNAATMGDARAALEARLFALSRTHNVLTRENWEGAGLKEIVAEALAPYRHDRENRLHMAEPDVRLQPRMALAIAMALQELATNAVKYGALSNETGEVHIDWAETLEDGEPRLRLVWEEKGGPPVEPPTRRGFGTRLIERSLDQDLDGRVAITFAPGGIVCTLDAPLQ